MTRATIYQRANFIVSIGCQRRLEICNDDGRTMPAGRMTYRVA